MDSRNDNIFTSEEIAQMCKFAEDVHKHHRVMEEALLGGRWVVADRRLVRAIDSLQKLRDILPSPEAQRKSQDA